ncbi:ECF RNA polymerase sigma-E factor [Rosistilla oblonga]|uniref:ECF RNA polymerase sigma-E factor n=3 Tax=Rosistilla TaxID=2795779 RepID=A0A518IYK2_9BACT|nr:MULTISPECIES: sigma-70 family RNA polymerase sigma factor [Rosistilla]QDS89739.1 ECF RNA polymerase sigma-E factor [Rosistilla ulvae]QDV13645.1 ECF RNA polymerase sigma-E factor [Rosistilla oblonga]QDV58166.1 ECF RNA polymerase sigma-E factor [Rosistilla oblonga]QDV70260.1 ECF RNA polymerase sigma-E factor [Rosistilla carotiformis]
MSQSTTQFLLDRAREGDADAFGELLEQYRSYLWILAHRYLDDRLRQRIDPADLVQITFMEAQRDLPAFRGQEPAAFVVWIRNILRNNLASAVARHVITQKRSVAHEVRLANDSSRGPGLAGQLAGSTTSPSQQIMRAETSQALLDALDQLPEMQAAAIKLRYMEGLNMKEISEAVGKTEMAVGGLLKRGLKRLREILLDESQ